MDYYEDISKRLDSLFIVDSYNEFLLPRKLESTLDTLIALSKNENLIHYYMPRVDQWEDYIDRCFPVSVDNYNLYVQIKDLLYDFDEEISDYLKEKLKVIEDTSLISKEYLGKEDEQNGD